MAWAPDDGYDNIVRLYCEKKATDANNLMTWATRDGHDYIVRLCRDCQLSQHLHLMVFSYFIIRLYIFWEIC